MYHQGMTNRVFNDLSNLDFSLPVIKLPYASDETIVADNWLSIAETFWFRLIDSIFQK